METENFKTVGIIAEYNPFHCGHAYHIRKAREITGADYVIAAMSGDFVQRGAPAVFDKYTRTQMALLCGADLVLELPNAFATSSAEDFAAAGVALLDKLGVVSSLCFGSECGETSVLFSLAERLLEEREEDSAALKRCLASGMSFPAAREKVYGALSPSSMDWNSPNNILGIEYCRAILKRHSSIRPVTIRREGMGYHETANDREEMPESLTHTGTENQGAFWSATAIRQALKKMESSGLDSGNAGNTSNSPKMEPKFDPSAVPPAVLTLLLSGKPLYPDDISSTLNYALLTLSREGRDFSSYLDVSRELGQRLTRVLLSPASFEERIFQLKTRQYTYTRISRALLHILLGITDADTARWKGEAVDYAPYARILGFKKTALPLLKSIRTHAKIPLITQVKREIEGISKDGMALLQQDIFASHLYQALLASKYQIPAKNEYQAGHHLLGYESKTNI